MVNLRIDQVREREQILELEDVALEQWRHANLQNCKDLGFLDDNSEQDQDRDQVARTKRTINELTSLRVVALVWSALSFFFVAGYHVGQLVTVGQDGIVCGLLFLFAGLWLALRSWQQRDFERIGKGLQ